MAAQKKTPKKTIPATSASVAKKDGLKAKSVKKPSTRDTLKKATLTKKNSSSHNSTKKPVSGKVSPAKSKTANKSKKTSRQAPAQKNAAVKAVSKNARPERKTTSELLKAIKAHNIETHTEADKKHVEKASARQKKAPPKAKSKSKNRIPLPIVPPMQTAVEIVIPLSRGKKKTRKFSFKKKDLELFRNDLLQIREHFTGQTKSMKHDALQRDDEVNPEEDGTDAFMRLQALNQMDDQQHIVADIDEALLAIEKGTYGTCEMCECLINRMRLKARPFAKFCVKCKSEMERSTRFNKPR